MKTGKNSKNLDDLLTEINERQRRITAKRPLKPEEIQQLKSYYKIGLTYASNALEGNSLTETETKVVLEDGLTIGGKPLRDHLEALGHQDAFDQLDHWLDSPLSESLICECHRLFYHRIDPENAGKYRTVRVFLSGSNTPLPPPAEVPSKMNQLIQEWTTLNPTRHPVINAAWLHYQFVAIHPFVDGNGRTARLLMNLILLQHGYPVAIIPPINRVWYIEALQAYNTGKSEPFFELIMETVIEAQKEYLRLLE